jgi:hypothetical protein
MDLSEHIAINRQLAECVCQRLTEEINELGFAAAEIQHYPSYDDAGFELIKDPFTGEYNLTCYWYDEPKKQRIGRLQFNSDGTFYAEYDVTKPHPNNAKRFVESVTAWGKAEQIKSEPKLLDMPE